jgi:hypothetical protein
MDINESAEYIVAGLSNNGRSAKDSLIICEKAIEILKQKITDNNLSGYKVTRFKKPLPPVEERKVYKRVCRRCDIIYPTPYKHSWFCNKCKLKGSD